MAKVLKYYEGVCTKKRPPEILTICFTKLIMQKNYQSTGKNDVFEKKKYVKFVIDEKYFNFISIYIEACQFLQKIALRMYGYVSL